MLLSTAEVGPFRSINDRQTLAVEPAVTVLVGMNEAGKTVVLKALLKTSDVTGVDRFDPIEDYPRKDLTTYQKKHKDEPAVAAKLTFTLTDTEVAAINAKLGPILTTGHTVTVSHLYDNSRRIQLDVNEAEGVKTLLKEFGAEAKRALKGTASVRGMLTALDEVSLTPAEEKTVAALKARAAAANWDSVLRAEAWALMDEQLPRFLYFSEYDVLPGKMNLADLAARDANAKTEPGKFTPGHRAMAALLRMVDVATTDLSGAVGYEELKAKLEAVSIALTDQVMEYWKQNPDLEVEIDIKADPTEEAPFNSGPNIYLRIKNKRHRGVSTPFDQRSRGFIWFFSFLVWFDSVQQQLGSDAKVGGRQLILLLDEPGLALHALAQADFLRYIDKLAAAHQVLYTTHSPFMIHSDRLNKVRLVEDQTASGTVIADVLGAADPRTIFPLQAALGYSIAQNLFISPRSLLVEGPSELIYLQLASNLLEKAGRHGLRGDVTIVPTGGLDNVSTFVSLLGASGLELAVLHDYSGAPDQKLANLVRERLLKGKAVFSVAQFRGGKGSEPSDIEDLWPIDLYLSCFNRAFAEKLITPIAETDLPAGTRIVDRLGRLLITKKIQLRPSGGFNHFAVASAMAASPPDQVDAGTASRFEALFSAINPTFKT